MRSIRKAVLVAICAVGIAAAAARPGGGLAAAAPAGDAVYVLKGYRFSGKLGPANTTGMVAKLKHQPGGRVTKADIIADAAIFAGELKARHMGGRYFVFTTENHGQIWVTFGLLDMRYPAATAWASRRLESQHFEGLSNIPTSALSAATRLKPGDTLSPENIDAARRAIMALFANSPNGTALTVKIKIQVRPNNEAALTWIIADKRKPAMGTGSGKAD